MPVSRNGIMRNRGYRGSGRSCHSGPGFEVCPALWRMIRRAEEVKGGGGLGKDQSGWCPACNCRTAVVQNIAAPRPFPRGPDPTLNCGPAKSKSGLPCQGQSRQRPRSQPNQQNSKLRRPQSSKSGTAMLRQTSSLLGYVLTSYPESESVTRRTRSFLEPGL